MKVLKQDLVKEGLLGAIRGFFQGKLTPHVSMSILYDAQRGRKDSYVICEKERPRIACACVI